MERKFTQNTNINHISTIYGKDRTEPIYCYADRMFPNSPDVHFIAYLKGFYCTSTYLMKNDLNGHFLTYQPGQPFAGKIWKHAGIVILPFNRVNGFTANITPEIREIIKLNSFAKGEDDSKKLPFGQEGFEESISLSIRMLLLSISTHLVNLNFPTWENKKFQNEKLY
jgi:hypothetical protein